jgi:hypothetical protein
MARSSAAIEINKFIAGLISDANPLTFPDNASLEEENFILNIDGSRERRLGLDFEETYSEITTTVADASTTEPAFSSYKWDNAGGDPDKSLLVIQIGTEVKFFDLDSVPISSGLLYTYDFSSADATQNFAYAVVDGILVVTTGIKQVTTFEYTSPSTITVVTTNLLVRDFFGVEDVISVNLYDRLDVRPSSTTNAHTYNLRNSSWAIPRANGSTSTTPDDMITTFYANSSSKFPSNSDNTNFAFYADTSQATEKTLERFWPSDLVKNPRGSIPAPTGYFIIDALERGTSRLAKEAELRATYTQLDYSVSTLPLDKTPGGATCVSEFAGRVFYAGFSGEVDTGDARSPRMSSYLLFSQVVRSVADVNKCFQEGDPTSKEAPDVVATDGGFIRINEAYGIQALINVGTSLLVLAKNGVWRVAGGSDYGFDATNYIVERITDHGIVSLDSIVVVDNTVMFWGQDGIYHVRIAENGAWVSQNITYGKIQNLYSAIPIADKRKAKGLFDNFERKVHWIYYNRLSDTAETKELILDFNLGAFYLNAIKQFTGSSLPRLLAPFTVNPYTISITTTPVVVNTEQVQVNGEDVVYPIPNVLPNTIKEIGYLVVTEITPVVKYSFAFFRNEKFRDWYSIDDAGVDAAAYVVTGYLAEGPGGKDYARSKGVPYLFVHTRRTENGFEEDINADLIPINQSSCKVQARWEWASSANSNRWGNEFQAYRYKRLYFPEDALDTFDIGFETIVTKNKLRGKGKVLSLKFSTEPYKNLHLYGWSLVMSIAGNV